MQVKPDGAHVNALREDGVTTGEQYRTLAQPQGETQDIEAVLRDAKDATRSIRQQESCDPDHCVDCRRPLSLCLCGKKVSRPRDAEIAAIRKNARDYQELLAENERLCTALKEVKEIALGTVGTDFARLQRILALPAVRELEGK